MMLVILWTLSLFCAFGGMLLVVKGAISRKEFCAVMFFAATCALLADILFVIQFPAVGNYLLTGWQGWSTYQWYKRWKRAGDDDDFRKRRRERIHNKLKKFEIKRIPQPVVVRGW